MEVENNPKLKLGFLQPLIFGMSLLNQSSMLHG